MKPALSDHIYASALCFFSFACAEHDRQLTRKALQPADLRRRTKLGP